MFHALTSFADAQKQAAVGRVVEDRVRLTALPRLLDLLASEEGSIEYRITFDNDATGRPCLHVHARGEVQLICQRTLEAFPYQLEVNALLGAIKREEEEAELLADYEPLLLAGGEERSINSIVEDEVLLALPPIPVKPGSEGKAPVWQESTQEKAHPFAALMQLKDKSTGSS
jgi:uncharacterized protein